MNFVRKLLLELVNLFLANRLIYQMLAYFHVFEAVFVMYPASPLYADHYTFHFRQRRITWKPFVTGIIKHPSGKRTLQFAISATEELIASDAHAEEMRSLYQHVVGIQWALCARSHHFAGIIPGRLVHLRVARPKKELESTAKNVVNAVMYIRQKLEHPSEGVVIVLGARGYVGREVAKRLKERDIKVFGVDIGDAYLPPTVPHVLLNITRPEAINDYIGSDLMGKETVLLNEVYPAPHESIVTEIKSLGARVFHIAGVDASSFPRFPSQYQGAVPCCAGLPEEEYLVEVVAL